MEMGSREARSNILAATTGRAEGFKGVEKNTGAMVGLLQQLVVQGRQPQR